MAGPANGVLEGIPGRPGFQRAVFYEDEFEAKREQGWERAKGTDGGKKFKESFTDPVRGKGFVMEMPVEEHKRYLHEHCGGRITDLQRKALLGKRDDKTGGEAVTIEDGELPPQANLRREEG
jgi:hypothetical protein